MKGLVFESDVIVKSYEIIPDGKDLKRFDYEWVEFWKQGFAVCDSTKTLRSMMRTVIYIDNENNLWSDEECLYMDGKERFVRVVNVKNCERNSRRSPIHPYYYAINRDGWK